VAGGHGRAVRQRLSPLTVMCSKHMAHKKAGGSTHLGRDSKPKYLGTKVGDGQSVKSGTILIRQRGTPIHGGKNVRQGKDDTLFAIVAGIVKFTSRKRTRFDGTMKKTKFVNVIPHKAS
jgi:large subunit ribosomal protein L27